MGIDIGVLVIQTAGDVAYSLNDEDTFQAIVMEGVRGEMIKAILEVQQVREPDEEEEEDRTEATEMPFSTASNTTAFLKARLRYEGSGDKQRCIDEEGNGVMMGWELGIMKETARYLCQGRRQSDSLSVLNIGFGLGLIDAEFQQFKPARHVIIEPHPDVLAFARSTGWYDKPGVDIFEGTWQDYIKAWEAGQQEAQFDVIYVG